MPSVSSSAAASTGRRPTVAEMWPDVDTEAATAFFRKWPPTGCKDLQRKPGMPAGLDTIRPGLWYFRHVLEPLESRTLSSITVTPTLKALMEDVEGQPSDEGVPPDVQAAIAAYIEQLPKLPLPDRLALKPHVQPPGKRSLARRLKKQQLLEQAPGAAAASAGTPEDPVPDAAAKRIKHAEPE